MHKPCLLTENVVADAGSIDLLISSNATVNVANIGTEFVTIGNITNGNIAYASITTSLSLLGRSILPRDPVVSVGATHDIWYSQNGYAFEVVNTTLFLDNILGVAGNKYFWIAIGKQVGGPPPVGPTMALSQDGVNWVAHPSPPAGVPGAIAYGKNLNKWVVGTSAGLFYSTDGINWTAGAGGPNVSVFANNFTTITALPNGKWLAGGDNGANMNIVHSDDGITWTLCTGTQMTDSCLSIAAGPGLIVAVGQSALAGDPKMVVSTDANGANWVVPTTPPTHTGGISVAVNKTGTVWVTCGVSAGGNPFWYSTDGQTWVASAFDSITNAVIGYDGTKFIVSGTPKVVVPASTLNTAVTFDGLSYVLNPVQVMTTTSLAIAANQERTYLAVN